MYFEDVRMKFDNAVQKLEPSTQATLNEASKLAEKEHQGQTRKQHAARPNEVDPYLIHPLRVSLILMEELGLCDKTSLASAILHD